MYRPLVRSRRKLEASSDRSGRRWVLRSVRRSVSARSSSCVTRNRCLDPLDLLLARPTFGPSLRRRARRFLRRRALAPGLHDLQLGTSPFLFRRGYLRANLLEFRLREAQLLPLMPKGRQYLLAYADRLLGSQEFGRQAGGPFREPAVALRLERLGLQRLELLLHHLVAVGVVRALGTLERRLELDDGPAPAACAFRGGLGASFSGASSRPDAAAAAASPAASALTRCASNSRTSAGSGSSCATRFL